MKRAGELFLVRSGLSDVLRERFQGRSAILAYHNVITDTLAPCGDVSLHLKRSRFAAQLDTLLEICRVVPLEDVLRTSNESVAEPRVAITFDDAYRGALTLGIAELVARDLPATLFVAPGLLGDRSLWWDKLAANNASGLDASVRARALRELGGDEARILEWAEGMAMTVSELPPECRTASLGELQAAANQPGISVASHSWSHRNLSRLTGVDLDEELRRSHRWLRERFALVIPWLSFPYGLSTKSVERAARETGYAAACRIDGGWLDKSPSDVYRLPRVNVPSGLSLNGLRLRLAGLFAR